jgi:hypothetical protein
MESIPERLRPIPPTNRSGEVKYFQFRRNESQATIEEREWLCGEVSNRNAIWDGQLIEKKPLIRRYNLNESFFRANLLIYNDPNRNFVSGSGYTDSVDDVGTLAVAIKMREVKAATGSDMKLSEVNKLMVEQIENSMVRRMSVNIKDEPIGSRSLKTLVERKGIYSEAPDMHTEVCWL